MRNGVAAFGHVDGPFVGILLARNAGVVLAMIVGAVPADQAQRIAADAEVSMEPVAPVRRRGDEAYVLIVLAENFLFLAVAPRRHADRSRPTVGVALAFDANQHRRRIVCVGLGVAAGHMFADESVEHVAGKLGLHPLVAGRTAGIEI